MSGGGAPPAPVREAATVVLARATPGGPPRIFMLRRSARSAFMPDALVFPGGRVEPEDGEGPDRFERAARRECLEETALELGARPLLPFDTWKTPSGESPRRFLARFFFAELDSADGAHAVADGVETHDGRWAFAREHLAEWEAGKIELPPPTLSILESLVQPDYAAWIRAARPQLELPILPKVHQVDSQLVILMPHDRDYAHAEGESAPAPARVRRYPTRFWRRESRWIPDRLLAEDAP